MWAVHLTPLRRAARPRHHFGYAEIVPSGRNVGMVDIVYMHAETKNLGAFWTELGFREAVLT